MSDDSDQRAVFIDESNYTGEDLLDDNQPVFAAASVRISGDDAAEILARTIGPTQAREAKFSRIIRRRGGEDRILWFVREVTGRYPDEVALCYMHKRFALFVKLVDSWLEPVLYPTGYDFYERGQAQSFCYMAYQCLRTFEGDGVVQALLDGYLRFMRAPTQESFDRFWDLVQSLRDNVRREESGELLDYILLGRTLGLEHVFDLGARPTDIALGSLMRLLIFWNKRFGVPFRVVHDASKNIHSMKWMVDAIADPSMEETLVGFDQETAYTLPLRVSELTFASSENTPELQVADLLAGVTATIARARFDRRRINFALKLAGTGIEGKVISTVWPETDPDKIVRLRPPATPEMKDPLETMGRVLLERRPQDRRR